jgi:hypothetical protein
MYALMAGLQIVFMDRQINIGRMEHSTARRHWYDVIVLLPERENNLLSSVSGCPIEMVEFLLYLSSLHLLC